LKLFKNAKIEPGMTVHTYDLPTLIEAGDSFETNLGNMESPLPPKQSRAGKTLAPTPDVLNQYLHFNKTFLVIHKYIKL
jgi:hypothetical protein